MSDNRIERKEGRSKRLVLHMHIPANMAEADITLRFDLLMDQLDNESQGVVNVGWRRYGEMKRDIVGCAQVPLKVRKEACFGELLGKSHKHLRVTQWFENPLMVVQA